MLSRSPYPSSAPRFRRYLLLGTDGAVAAWAVVASGVYSSLALVGLTAVGSAMTGSAVGVAAGLLALFGGVLPAAVAFWGLRKPRIQALLERLVTRTLVQLQRLLRRPAPDCTTVAVAAIAKIAALRLDPADARMAARFAILNWTTDIACLAWQPSRSPWSPPAFQRPPR